jgi:hypothetical protein
MKASQLRKVTASMRAARRSVRNIERALDKPRAVPAPATSGRGSRTVTSATASDQQERPG